MPWLETPSLRSCSLQELDSWTTKLSANWTKPWWGRIKDWSGVTSVSNETRFTVIYDITGCWWWYFETNEVFQEAVRGCSTLFMQSLNDHDDIGGRSSLFKRWIEYNDFVFWITSWSQIGNDSHESGIIMPLLRQDCLTIQQEYILLLSQN